MNMNDLAKRLCELETGKAEVNIAQMKEILKQVSMYLYAHHDVLVDVLKYGQKKSREEWG